MRINEVDKHVTQTDIDQLEVFADRLFGKVGIDVEFTRHFLDRVNDERNIKQITMSELTRLFKQEYKRWAKPIAQLGPDAEAVMKDMVTDINLPFALRWDHQNKELDLIAKTVMRKKNFKTSNKEFEVEGLKSLLTPNRYKTASERLHQVLQRKEKENAGKPFRHALGWYAAKIAGGFRHNIDTRELIAYYQKHFNPVLSESTLPYITEEAAIDYWKNASASDFQKKFNMTRAAANQSIRTPITQLFPDGPYRNNPKVNVRLGNWIWGNPDLAKQLGQKAANSNIKPSFWSNFKGQGLKALPRILGGVVLQVLWPTTLGDGTISDETLLQHKIIQSVMRADPKAFMNDLKDYYKTTKNPEGWKDDWDYKQAESYRNDEIAKSLETLKGLQGKVDPPLRKAADELAKKMRDAKTQDALDDLIGKVDPALQKALDALKTSTSMTPELSPDAVLNPKTSPTDLGFYPLPDAPAGDAIDAKKVKPQRIPDHAKPWLFPPKVSPTGPVDKPIKEPVKEPAKEPAKKTDPTKDPIKKTDPVEKPKGPVDKPIKDPVEKPKGPVDKPIEPPVKKPDPIKKTDPKKTDPVKKTDPLKEPKGPVDKPIEPPVKKPDPVKKTDPKKTDPVKDPDPYVAPDMPGRHPGELVPAIAPNTTPFVPRTMPGRHPEFDPSTNPEIKPFEPPIDNPEAPVKPEQPKIDDQPEIPQPFKLKPSEIPFIPKTSTFFDPEIAFQPEPFAPITTATGASPTGTGTGTGNNKNDKKKRKKDKDGSDGSGDFNYDDPLQRWQKKYGMWEH